MPEKAYDTYGAPRMVYLEVASAEEGELDLTFTTTEKLPTMIGEATLVTFRPAPALERVGNGSAWRLDKLGQPIDPEAVQDGGNQYTHGVWKGATVSTTAGQLAIEALDSVNMNSMTAE